MLMTTMIVINVRKKVIRTKEEKLSQRNLFERNEKILINSIFCCLVCPDVYGIPRLRQTLELHQWSNMNLKGN